MLNRMRDLAVQAANTGANDATARTAAQEELSQLRTEIDRIGNTTSFGDTKLLNGSYGVSAASATRYDADGSVTVASGGDVIDITVDGGTTVSATISAGTYASGDALATEFENQIKAALQANTGEAEHADNVSVTATAAGAGFNLEISIDGLADTETFTIADNGSDTLLADLNFGAVTAASGSGGTFQVGANNTGDDQITVAISGVSSSDLGLAGLDLATDAASAIDSIDTAIASVSTQRGNLGAVQNRLESTISNLQVTSENLAASESRIRDTDVAAEMVEFTRAQILQQAGTAMLGQANAVPQSVLRLLG